MKPKAELRLLAGRPYPLGVHWDGAGANVAVFSGNEIAA